MVAVRVAGWGWAAWVVRECRTRSAPRHRLSMPVSEERVDFCAAIGRSADGGSAFADAVTRLLSCTELRRRLGEAGRSQEGLGFAVLRAYPYVH